MKKQTRTLKQIEEGLQQKFNEWISPQDMIDRRRMGPEMGGGSGGGGGSSRPPAVWRGPEGELMSKPRPLQKPRVTIDQARQSSKEPEAALPNPKVWRRSSDTDVSSTKPTERQGPDVKSYTGSSSDVKTTRPFGGKIDEAATQTWQMPPNLIPQDDEVAANIQLLGPSFRDSLARALKDYPGQLRVTSAFRDQKRQSEIVKQRRAEIKKYEADKEKWEKANPGKEYPVRKPNPAAAEVASHRGYAIDINPADLRAFHKWNKAQLKKGIDYGLETGLEWKDTDNVHLQQRDYKTALARDQVEHGWEAAKDMARKGAASVASGAAAVTKKAGELTGAAKAEVDAEIKRLANLAAAKKAEDEKKAAERAAQADARKLGAGYASAAAKTASAEKAAKKDAEDKKAAAEPSITPSYHRQVNPDLSTLQPSQQELEKARSITGKGEPLFDPETGLPTTEKALKAKIEKAAAEKAKADQEAKAAAEKAKAAEPQPTTTATTKTADADWKQIYNLNKSVIGKNPNVIKPGQVLSLPDGGSYTVKPGDTLGSIAKSSTSKPAQATVKPEVKPEEPAKLDKGTEPSSIEKSVEPTTSEPGDSPFGAEPPAKMPTVPSAPELEPIEVIGTKEIPNVVRDTSGKPITTGTGEPIATGTSDEIDIAAAKQELADLKKLSSIPPYEPEPKATPGLMDRWKKFVDVATGYKGVPREELGKIQVPESVNNELDDILWLSGRQKK